MTELIGQLLTWLFKIIKDKNMSCLHNEEVKESIQNEVAEMSVNDFSNLVEKHDLGIDVVDDIFYRLVEKIFEERAV